MGLFWTYFRETLRFPLIWAAGPLSAIAEGGAAAMDAAHTVIPWLREQALPSLCEDQFVASTVADGD